MKEVHCLKCGFVGKPKNETPGSFIFELFLWFCFLLPGLIYSIWRITNKKLICRYCKHHDQLIPADSPSLRSWKNGLQNRLTSFRAFQSPKDVSTINRERNLHWVFSAILVRRSKDYRNSRVYDLREWYWVSDKR